MESKSANHSAFYGRSFSEGKSPKRRGQEILREVSVNWMTFSVAPVKFDETDGGEVLWKNGLSTEGREGGGC